MLNEFVYCPRLFYIEHVEGVFLENADTLRGEGLHRRVDTGSGALPAPDSETIHARSVTLGSERLGVTARLDLVESAEDGGVCPVDYKAGAPREGEAGLEIWPSDQVQLAAQILLLRDNGYPCTRGFIYYRKTKQRVTLDLTPELEAWALEQIAAARALAASPQRPPPLVHSPKCPRCSLAPVCLPDETHALSSPHELSATPAPVRRLMAARDERRALYLNTQGLRVGVSEGMLIARGEGAEPVEIRLSDIHHIALFGGIQISTQAIQELCQREIPILYFSMGGWFYGLTRGHALANILTRRRQFARAEDAAFCLELARHFIAGKIRNTRTLLMRNAFEPPAPALARLAHAAEDARHATSLEELLGIEGAAASTYFAEFSRMLKPRDELDGHPQPETRFSFDFQRRNRRPPADPVNALLSLAYSLLAKDCTVATLACGLDPWLGFYHQPRPGRPALALDLMEEFRPLIAESAVLSAINNGMISPSDFLRAGEAVALTPAGRKRFFHAYEQRMASEATHPLFGYKASYRRLLELQARLLSRVLDGEIPSYIPFTTR